MTSKTDFDKILKTFANKTRSLEMVYLLEDIKKAVRLDANPKELKNIKKFCEDHSLYLEMSDFKVVKIVDEGKGSFANIVKKVNIADPREGLSHVYISKSKDRAMFLKLLESKGDDKAVGKVLGYPECCTEFFENYKDQQKKIQNDYILPALSDSKGYEFSFVLNHAARYFDRTLLSHFPCNFNCEESKKIAQERLNLLEERYPEISKELKEKLRGAIVYTERDGVFLMENVEIDKNTLNFEKVTTTKENILHDLLSKNRKMEIIGKNKIKIDDTTISDIGFMLFT